MKLELITAEGPATLWMRKGRLIRFPQLTMPLLAALTPDSVEIHHTDEIVVFQPRQMTPDQLQAGVEWTTKQFYSMRSISRRLLGGSRTGLWWNIPRNLGYKVAFDKLRRPGYNPARPPGQVADRPLEPPDSLAADLPPLQEPV